MLSRPLWLKIINQTSDRDHHKYPKGGKKEIHFDILSDLLRLRTHQDTHESDFFLFVKKSRQKNFDLNQLMFCISGDVISIQLFANLITF